MRHHPCTCRRKAIPSGRYYMGQEACRICGRLIPLDRPMPTPAEPEPAEAPDRGEVIAMGAQLFRTMPHLTNTEVYDRLADEMPMPALVTWATRGWAAEARKMSGTPPIAGRPAS